MVQRHLKALVHLSLGRLRKRSCYKRGDTDTHSLVINHRLTLLTQQQMLTCKAGARLVASLGKNQASSREGETTVFSPEPGWHAVCSSTFDPSAQKRVTLIGLFYSPYANKEDMSTSWVLNTKGLSRQAPRRQRQWRLEHWKAGSGPSSGVPSCVTSSKSLTLPESLSCLIQKMRRFEQITPKGPASF